MDKQLKDLLRTNVVVVRFKKADGTERVMNCTLRDDVVVPHEKTTERVKPVNESVCPVWDIDKKAWRSFRYDSVMEYQPYYN